MVDVYHEFSHPHEMLQNLCHALKPGGRIAFVEYRMEDPNVPIKLLHKMSQLQVMIEATPHPLEWVRDNLRAPPPTRHRVQKNRNNTGSEIDG